MLPLIIIQLLFSLLLFTNVLSQESREINTKQDILINNDAVENYNRHSGDYKIISSTSSYIELEFYPGYLPDGKIIYNNEVFSVINFEDGVTQDILKFGQPDVRSRFFPVLLPSWDNNTVTVIDYDVRELKGINLAPIPSLRFIDPSRRDFENIELAYIKDSKLYSENRYFPQEIASLSKTGAVRENIISSLAISPYQYNPVSRVLKLYTRLRVRITFGGAPVNLTRQRHKEEINLLQGMAINSDIGLNWMNPKLINYPKDNFRANSVLSTGDLYKIEIKDNTNGGSDAIYKMTRSFLEGAGINFSNVDPRTIKMYGNGGKLLPDKIDDLRPVDLVEIAIYIEGEADGKFDPQDYVLFYGSSINNWNYDSLSGYRHYVNYHTNSNYYWIQINTSGNGKRMINQPSENVANPIIPSSFTEKLFSEPEITNPILEGNIWLSERKSGGQSFIWNNTLTGLEANTDILYKIKPAVHVICTPVTNHMLLKEKHSTMSEIFFQLQCVLGGYNNYIWTAETNFIINASQKTNGEQSSFEAAYYCNDPNGEGYYDWMEILYKRRFNSVLNDFMRFDSPDTTATVEYNISSFSNNNIKVFDATAHSDVKLVQPLNVSSTNVRFQKSQVKGQPLNKFFTIGQGYNKTPTSISQKISNQNLRGAYNDGASFIIITHKDFLPAANRLKTKREAGGVTNPNYLKTYVFETDKIYNEFSGGLFDAVAIRDFLKYCYDNWQLKPVYVCFLGDGDMDYKNVIVSDGNWVPAYQYTDPFMHPVNGYTSDDFYADVVSTPNFIIPDLAHGRITAQSLQEANSYLDKIDCYEDPNYNGYWKNRAAFVADDGKTFGGNDGSQHTDQCERLAEYHTPQTIDRKKLYLVLYPPVVTSSGIRKPDVNKDIVKNWNDGCISMHYTGHGSPEAWAHEYVLEKDVTVTQLKNQCKYPFITVASCDFSKFDNPLSQSGGELFIISPMRGGIGSLGATRPTYGTPNEIFINTFWRNLYFKRDTLLLQQRFGKAVFLTKLAWHDKNDLKFVLICDPSLRAQIPRFKSRIDSISGLKGNPFDIAPDTMRALSRIKIYGSILNPDSTLWTGYNGKIYLKIFDVPKYISMLDEYGAGPFNFKLQGGTIYSGTQSVANGKWIVEYIVPKDISYLNKNGKIINYFYNNQADGSGLDTNFIVGGIDPTAGIDTTGPQIKLYLNTRNFRSGDVVNENFKLIADFYDESGMNTTGTIGHKIEAVLDNNEAKKYDLTDFYNGDTTYKAGSIEYDFSSISTGKHTLRVKGWDTYNNSSQTQIEFDISISAALQVMNVYNYPNPFKNNTAFTFQHNYPNAINVKIKIYTVAGRLIKEIEQNNVSDKFVVINWTGKDADGETLGNGIYIYKLIVDSGDGASVSNIGKMAVLK